MIQGIITKERYSKTTIDEITEEALILEGAGTDSTGQALENATFYILNDTEVAAKLRDELVQAMPDPSQILPLPKLKELKYLVGGLCLIRLTSVNRESSHVPSRPPSSTKTFVSAHRPVAAFPVSMTALLLTIKTTPSHQR